MIQKSIKEVFKCKYSGCNSKCYLLYESSSNAVSLWYNEQEHQHDGQPEKAERAIDPVTKREIEKMYLNNKVTYPTRILSSLRNVTKKIIPNPDKNGDPFISNPFYTEGVDTPSRNQIKNFIQNSIKPRQGIKEFSYADLAVWANEHRKVPDDNNEPFVISDFIQVNDDIPELSIIRIAISTKNMIGLAKKRKHICADATYKLIWQGKYIYLFFLYI